MPDSAPWRITRIEEVGARNHAGEIVFLVDAMRQETRKWRPPHDPFANAWWIVHVMAAANPWTGEITRCAIKRPASAAGYVVADPAELPGMLRDVLATIALEAGAAEQKQRDEKFR